MGATRFFHFTLLSTALLCLVSSHHHYHHYRHVYQFPPFHIQPPPLGHSYGTYDELDIVPELVGGGPQSDIQVLYNVNGTLATVNFGNDLTPTEVKEKPITYWFGDPRSYYTLMMIDPDAPSRKDQKLSPILHYLVGNIPGHDVNKGHIIADYRGAMPPKGSGFHRYIFLLYQQIKKIDFKEPHIPSSSVKGRLNFPVRNFTEQYQLFRS
ncbi:protein D3-like [Diaphorina citri]|uniref:Protein D3-like n=1 Tax=Diaphorina citri TaxID=121845 RepID=A0A3Q0IMD6_DIACI|nr:protein D3-like [Diaphorina citri]